MLGEEAQNIPHKPWRLQPQELLSFYDPLYKKGKGEMSRGKDVIPV